MDRPEGGGAPESWTDWATSHATELTFLAGVFVISLVIRSYDLQSLVAYPDELTYVSRAIHIVGTHWEWPLPDMWDQPPLLEYILAVIIATVGGTLDSLRLVSVVSGSTTVVLVYLLGKSMYGRTAGFFAAVGLMFDGYEILYSRVLYIEALATMLIMAAILLFYEGVVKRKSPGMAVLGGIFFGLALDSKYIAMVLGVGFLFFLLLYYKRFEGGFPRRQALMYFGIALLVLLPVVVDLAINGANPLYFDLEYRFQATRVASLADQIKSGAAFGGGFERFVQIFFHISSTNPYGVFPALVLNIPIWTAVVLVGILFYFVSFVLRKNVADGLLAIVFALFLAFAFTYPGKRSYFALYPQIVFFVMLGRIAQSAIEHLGPPRETHQTRRLAALCFVGLMVGGIAINAMSVPDMHLNGFGDWDEMFPIMSYISAHSGNDTYVATSLAEIGFYVKEAGINATLIGLVQRASLYSEPVANQTLLTPASGQYPIYWVVSPTVIEKVQPQFIVMPRQDFQATTQEFQTFVENGYYQPINTKLILLFEIKPGANSPAPGPQP
jgi:4-amino-4-deoxy-L-arabinose transferase-like glycosyltransferase